MSLLLEMVRNNNQKFVEDPKKFQVTGLAMDGVQSHEHQPTQVGDNMLFRHSMIACKTFARSKIAVVKIYLFILLIKN